MHRTQTTLPVLALLFAGTAMAASLQLRPAGDASAWSETRRGSGPTDCRIGVGDPPKGFVVVDDQVDLGVWSQGPNECAYGVGRQRVWPVVINTTMPAALTGSFFTGVGHRDPLSNAVVGFQGVSGGQDVGPMIWYSPDPARGCADIPVQEIRPLPVGGAGPSSFRIALSSVIGNAQIDALRVEVLACPRGPFGVVQSSLAQLQVEEVQLNFRSALTAQPAAPTADVGLELLKDPASGGLIARVNNTGPDAAQVVFDIHSTYGGVMGKSTLVATDGRCQPVATPNAYRCDLGAVAAGTQTDLLFGLTYYVGTTSISGYPFYIRATLNATPDSSTSNNDAQFRI